MQVNLPTKVRFALYVITGVLTPVFAVLTEQKFLPDWTMTLWMAEVTFVSALAAFNVNRK